MNILVVNYRDRLHPAAGGAEKHLHRIFSLIAQMGHQVVLFTTSFKGAKPRENVDGIQVIRKGSDLMFQLNCALNLKKLDREFHFDVVVEDLNKLPLFTPLILKKPVLVQMHHLWKNSIFYETSFFIALGVWFFERLIPLFYSKQKFVVVSPSTKRELSGIGIDESRITVIYNGSDDCGPTPEDDVVVSKGSGVPYFLWLSRIHKYKGIWTALEAFKEFSKKHNDVKLVVAGDGPLLKKLPAWLKQHDLTDKVDLLGFVTREKKRELLAGAVALLQTSFKEGWGLTVVEAAKLGTTSIASDVPGLRDSVRNGETGLLFQAGDASACASEMERLYCNDDLRSRLACAAKNYAEEFRWDIAAELTFDLLQNIVIEYQVTTVGENER